MDPMPWREPRPLSPQVKPSAVLAATLAIVLGGIRGAPAARASDTDQFGFGARPISMGNAFTALATDWTGTYYNPGAMAAARSLSVGLGFSYGGYSLDYDSAAGTDDDGVARQTPLSAVTIGVNAPLGTPGDFLSRFSLGLGVFLPTRGIVSAEVETSPGTPQYFLYGARRDKISMMPALAVRILPLDANDTPVLAIGGGATILADLQGDFVFDLSATAARSVSTKIKLPYDVAPNFGLYFQPVEWLSMGLAYRGELSLKAEFDVQIVVDGVNLFPLVLEAVTLYQPQQVAFGIALDPLDVLTVSFDVTWANWSAYNDAFVTIEPVIPQADVDFKDIFVPRLGLELEPVTGIAFRLGYYYQQSPIPSQPGPTNLIDLDKHVISFGVGWTWRTEGDRIVREGDVARIEKVERAPVSVDAFFQWHHLVQERASKDPALSPQTGGFYEAGGEIFNVGIQLTIRL